MKYFAYILHVHNFADYVTRIEMAYTYGNIEKTRQNIEKAKTLLINKLHFNG